jgi:hypothetical protein
MLPNDLDLKGKPITFHQNHHCSYCKHCTFMKDHHCLFTCICIGYRNYKIFLLFSFYMALTCFITTWLLLIAFY